MDKQGEAQLDQQGLIEPSRGQVVSHTNTLDNENAQDRGGSQR
jgi:hypothetical protein